MAFNAVWASVCSSFWSLFFWICSETFWCNTFLLANVSYATWKSSQEGVSFEIFPSTHFWLTQNTQISKHLVCQEVSFPGLIDCQDFQNHWQEALKWQSRGSSVALDFSISNFILIIIPWNFSNWFRLGNPFPTQVQYQVLSFRTDYELFDPLFLLPYWNMLVIEHWIFRFFWTLFTHIV